PLQQPGQARIHLVLDEPAEALGDAGELLREFLRAFVEEFQLAIVVVEEFPVHVAIGSRVSWTFPEPTSTSATNSIGTSKGRQAISPETLKRTRWLTSSKASSRSMCSVSRLR